MSIILDLLLLAWVPAVIVYIYGSVLAIQGRIGPRTKYAAFMVTDAVMLARQVADTAHYGVDGYTWLIAGWAAALWWDHRMWRKHRDDDDDLGKRLRSWARSHLPRPEIIRIRPIEQVTG